MFRIHVEMLLLSMLLFNFHYHHAKTFGIYNPELNEAFPDFSFSAGLHPKDLDEHAELYFERMKSDSQSQHCVAIGECGLDGLIDVDETLQETYFKKQILWANEIRKPLIIHCVRKFDRLSVFKKMAKVPMVVHGFNKKKTIADALLKQGFYLSFGKAVLQNVSLQQIVREIPENRFFLETDADEFNIKELYQKVAKIRAVSIEQLHAQILKNYETITTL